MGKNLIQQRRGKGTARFRAPSFRYVGEARHICQKESVGEVVDVVHCQGHTSPLIQVKYANGDTIYKQAPEGIKVGDKIVDGSNAEIRIGNTLPLKNIPEGIEIHNIESMPGDGGKFVRTSGTFGKIVAKLNDKIIVLLPSKRERQFLPDCRASIGIVAGSGRPEKPLLKAGTKHFLKRARNKFYPITSGISMNAVDHPFGGKSSHIKGRPTQCGRFTPPGRKVGKLRPRRTGRTKR